MSAAALQKMMESALMPVEMTSFLLECQSSLDCVSFFPLGARPNTWVADKKQDMQRPEKWRTSRSLGGSVLWIWTKITESKDYLMSPLPSP